MDVSGLARTYRLAELDKQLGNQYWSPVDVAPINDWVLRMAAVQGEFHWHTHNDDEFFLIYRGRIAIDTPQGTIELQEGEGTVIPRGTPHRPRAAERAVILLLEPARVRTTGDDPGAAPGDGGKRDA